MKTPEKISDRVNWVIELAWNITIQKIANKEITINKEASLQMHYSTILKTLLDLIKFSPKEKATIELETNVIIDGKPYIIDILISYTDGITSEKHSIELKCYKTLTSTGKKRGASDIWKIQFRLTP